ncbi:efflux RND transporter periplasmic adaptor subunit [Hyphomicrobium sp.]|uniref:efflux RND transporter periplasmic adaptor subunit n=1 Tax=Hyphomicrobium sp. TaxID=82 RepID=UPI000F98E7FD|nr:efflux RND transporter periplasmic adaptor subunit [Hyphomicrobium sp.]RUO98890.1 MAG: efflux RND transporter periplasmic adaptor subunit [Hyphomicrobium sp.]
MSVHTHLVVSKALKGSAAGVALLIASTGMTLAQETPGRALTSVSVATVQPREPNTWDEFSGRLEAIERVDLRPRVAGQIVAIHFREGALVKAGDSLVTIDPAPYAAEVERLNGVVAAAQAQAVFTKADVARARQIIGNALSERELDTRANAYDAAVANLKSAEAALRTAKLNLEWTEVRAPVSGRVGRREITVGNLVEAGANAPLLTTLVSVNPIYASFNADENIVAKALATLSPEANATAHVEKIPVEMATANNGGVWRRGTLQLIDNKVDVASGTVRLRATFDNGDGRLIAGQFVRVRLAQPHTAQVLAVSERAIGTDQDKKYVMIVDKANKTAYREVKLGSMTDNLRIITNGLNAGERVIVAGLQHVKPGDEVAPEQVAMDGRPVPQEHAAADISQ